MVCANKFNDINHFIAKRLLAVTRKDQPDNIVRMYPTMQHYGSML